MPAIHHGRATMFGLSHHAGLYQRLVTRVGAPMYERVTADVVAAHLPAGARVLDVGTGPGLLPLRLAAACPQVRIDAVDLSAEMIEQARRNAGPAGESGLTFAVADVVQLPYPDGSFDLVVSSISQHHWADPRAGLREIGRVLRPGGSAWIYDFRWALRRAQRALGEPGDGFGEGFTVTRPGRLAGRSRFGAIGRLVIERSA